MLTKDFGLTVKKVSDEGVFEGYASMFGGPPDSYGDVVMPGAFANSLAKHKREGTMPSLLWGHNHNELPIGSWQDMAEDGKGLWAQGQLNVNDPVGQRVHAALKAKSVRGLSIGYRTISEERDPKNPRINQLHELDLWEVSVVNFPANRRSLINAVKSGFAVGQEPTVREFEGTLRELGFSKALAEKIATSSAPHLRGDPDVADTSEAQHFLKRMLG